MELIREHQLLYKLAIVDGIGRCGKSLFMNMLMGFESIEKMQFNRVLEYIAIADKFKKISQDAAIAILQTEMDTALYNNMIGRNINTRLSDDTSLYKYHTPEKYLQRSLNIDGPVVTSYVQNEKPIYLCWTHDLIHKSDVIFNAFQEKLLFFYINRDPIDLVYEWHFIKNYTARMSTDPTEMQFCIKYKNTSVPEIASGWEEEFLETELLDRAIKLIHTCFSLNYNAIKTKKEKHQNIYIFNFEEFSTQPMVAIEKIERILNKQALSILNKILIESRCPRVLNTNEYENRKSMILQNASPKYANLLAETQNIYEKIVALSHLEKITA